jgi:capping protein beta
MPHRIRQYRKLYFEGGTSSAYFFNTDDDADSESFGACFLIHKEVAGVKGIASGWWDSIHVFAVEPSAGGSFDYSLTTTVMVSMAQKSERVDLVNLAGSLTQQQKKTAKFNKDNGHIPVLGKMLEDMELKLRNSIEGLYIQKTRQVGAVTLCGHARFSFVATLASVIRCSFIAYLPLLPTLTLSSFLPSFS